MFQTSFQPPPRVKVEKTEGSASDDSKCSSKAMETKMVLVESNIEFLMKLVSIQKVNCAETRAEPELTISISSLISIERFHCIPNEKKIFSLFQGKHQDKLLLKTKQELDRLRAIVSKLTGERDSIESNSAEGDSATDSRCDYEVYCTNIHPDTPESAMESYFSKFGVVEATLILRRHEAHKLGIVRFAEKSSVEQVLRKHHSLDNKTLIVKRSLPPHKRPPTRREAAKYDHYKTKSSMASRRSRYSPY